VTWMDWVLVSVLSLAVLANIAMIGEEREPITPAQATFSLILNAALIAGVVAA